MSDNRPCPNCGHCPTCGRSNQFKPMWVYPYWVPVPTPYYPPNVAPYNPWGYTWSASDGTSDSVSMSSGGAQ